MKTLSLIATAAITATAAIAVPAFARVGAPSVPAPTDTVSATQRICVVDAMTAQRIPDKECHTRAEWAAMGIDPLVRR